MKISLTEAAIMLTNGLEPQAASDFRISLISQITVSAMVQTLEMGRVLGADRNKLADEVMKQISYVDRRLLLAIKQGLLVTGETDDLIVEKILALLPPSDAKRWLEDNKNKKSNLAIITMNMNNLLRMIEE